MPPRSRGRRRWWRAARRPRPWASRASAERRSAATAGPRRASRTASRLPTVPVAAPRRRPRPSRVRRARVGAQRRRIGDAVAPRGQRLASCSPRASCRCLDFPLAIAFATPVGFATPLVFRTPAVPLCDPTCPLSGYKPEDMSVIFRFWRPMYVSSFIVALLHAVFPAGWCKGCSNEMSHQACSSGHSSSHHGMYSTGISPCVGVI